MDKGRRVEGSALRCPPLPPPLLPLPLPPWPTPPLCSRALLTRGLLPGPLLGPLLPGVGRGDIWLERPPDKLNGLPGLGRAMPRRGCAAWGAKLPLPVSVVAGAKLPAE